MSKQLSIITSCYRGEKYLSAFFESISRQTIFSEIEVVLIANDPTEGENTIIESFQKEYPENINYIKVPREPISVSMNRAIREAHGLYIFNWDIDDLRTDNSIELQYKILSSDEEIMLTYGNFIITREFGSLQGVELDSPEFEREEFMRSMHCGPFRAWKKSVHQKVGYFDEQLKSGADFDLMIRIATFFPMKKTQGLLGYYLNANTGLSTGGQKTFFSLQARELKIINFRYNILSKIDFFVPIHGYNIYNFFYQGQYIPISQFGFPDRRKPTLVEQGCSLIFTLKYGALRCAKYIYLTFKGK